MTEASLLTGFQRCAGGSYASVMNKKIIEIDTEK